MRRKRRSTKMKAELGQSVDHFKRAASLAAQETGATVSPRITAARDYVQPAAVKAKDAASSSWDSALAAITPLVAAATDSARQSAKTSDKVVKANKKDAKKHAKKVEKRANKALNRKQGSKASTLAGLALVGAAVGVAAAYVMRRRQAAQWDEYDPSAPIASTTPTPVTGADDAAFEPKVGYSAPGTTGTTGYSAPSVTPKD
jgi:hypothetical protein